ncbi:DUF202 domain-containing protein [Rhodococcus jostii]|uniref:DUF202 domain-containing protein n=1 Tax=Rhodococcus jostii TaxID=132919 RepID=UPI00362735BB
MGTADEGLATERTTLSWQRTAFSTVAVTAAISRLGEKHGATLMVVACLLATLTVAIGSRSRCSRSQNGSAIANAGLALSVFILATAIVVAMTASP